jgi:hypothetical protein
MTRAKSYLLEGTPILAHGDFAFGTAIDIVENYFWHAPLRERS